MKKQQNVALNASSFAWNTIGSIVSAGSSFILLSCVTQAVGATDGGIFAFAFSAAQLLLTLGKYGVRSYQATDVTRNIGVESYFVSRILSCAAMLLSCVLMIVLLGYSGVSAGIIFAVCLLKMVDAVEDVYHGQLQLNNKLNIAGMLLAFRNMLTIILFAVLMLTTKNIALTCWGTAVVSLIACVLINHPVLQKVERVSLKWNRTELTMLLGACLPLFVGQFLSLYIYNAPKYAIEIYCTDDIQTYYNVIFMPAFAINLLSEFIFKPLLTTLAMWWDSGERKKFSSLVFKMLLFILGVTVVVLVATYFIGAPLLSFVFNVDIAPYRTELMILMLGGGFGAAVYFLYNVLTSMREQKRILINYAVSAAIISIAAFAVVGSYGITAAALSYLVAEVVLAALMIWSVIAAVRRHQEKGRG